MKPDEGAFQAEIVAWLIDVGGYEKVSDHEFDRAAGLDFGVVLQFVGATQVEQWEELVAKYGDVGAAQRGFKARLVRELDARGTVDVLRRGVVDRGVTIRLAYFKPASGVTPELVARYEKNVLAVVPEFRYDASNENRIDLALLVNGLPVATAELKNALTGSGIDDAKAQYRDARDPNNVTLARRCVVHFAVDTERVAMTTRLAGAKTRFLPFDQGNDRAAGNPPNPNGQRTAYLWERVWQRDAWLDLLQRFVHVENLPRGSKRARNMIFPRFHQWDAVRKLEEAAKTEGPGHDYLIQHSAGSGKSNTIGWLAHRLSTVHGADERPVFDKIVVITDRRVLDKQLQETIYQFEHQFGLVEKIDSDSGQLATALAGQRARIIITTLQKFPVVVEQGLQLPDRNYAVIVDEAHSSQTGESATKLKALLGAGEPERTDDPVGDALAAMAKARGKQPNISFFAFTATPKGRTLEMFGRRNSATNRHEAFHLYSMRQAIEEKFIIDVLANYVTYQTYWNIEKKVRDDPAYDPRKAGAAIARFVSLHESNLAQKAEVIIEHFRRHVKHKIGGRAKAMVVTPSREHAVRYTEALRKYCDEHGYRIGVLGAFSGTVEVDKVDHTETSMNGFPESQTAKEFAGEEWHVLVVAEKYQTGFDQPLLYAMYVDKTLSGLDAVQTLSRLNRIADGKDGTFVLDFRNKTEDIQESFAEWYTSTVAQPTDPNLLYDTRHQLDPYGVIWPDEVEKAVALLIGNGKNHGRVHAALTPAVERFHGLDEDEQSMFRDALARFLRTYSFLSQIVEFTDSKLEADFLYGKALSAFIRPAGETGLDLGAEVELAYLRIEKTFAGSIELSDESGDVSTIFSGAGKQTKAEEEPLSAIIAKLNERFNTDFAEGDRVHLDAMVAKMIDRPEVQRAAAANTEDNFRLFLAKIFTEEIVNHVNVSKDLSLTLIDNPDAQSMVLDTYLKMVQGKAKVAYQEHCPIGDLLGPDMESAHLEYKASLSITKEGVRYKPLETASLKTIAAFANSRDGGTLLIGIHDSGVPVGLEPDFAHLRKPGKDDTDLFGLHLNNLIVDSMGAALAANVSRQMHDIDGKSVCRIHVHPSGFPVDARVTVEKKGQQHKETKFFVRTGNSTRALDEPEKAKYVLSRWPAS
ncbi:RNA-binding domain-containing protein [Amycolatopsis tolypomycina]|uniref:RNA-binding domain-containing protein n=1 Tax=Amycolatopsis tolypomycina TaxID=208445 RepID=UPI0033AA7E8C